MAVSMQKSALAAGRVEFVPFHLPSIGDEEIRAVAEVLRSGWLTTGMKVKQFESDFARYLGCGHAVALNSCTAALHLALEAIGVEEGDEVIVPTMTFTATAEVALYFKARPVLVDCLPDTLNMDPERVEKAVTPKSKAIIPVHFGGHPCDLAPILEIARRRKLFVIEDAAHALPAKYRGQTVGTIGDITCFSFYATKTMTTGEGGMATTENPEWADRMRMMSLHGISQDAWKRYGKEGSWYYEVLRPGFKYNLTDIAAAIGIVQLKKCDAFAAARNKIAASYDERLSKLPGVQTPRCRPEVEHAWHLYVIQLDPDRLSTGRDQFIAALKARGVGASVHFIPLHLHPYYRDAFGYAPDAFPSATEAYRRIVSLPIYPAMNETEVDHVLDAVSEVVERHRL
ncbi:MAG TPA: DegT/DnrJ/EryC1/StrS family aminotransferase [Methylomirabilota bacterium]|nr:DegT/DnrJ/EryC1/StrS family aminotransferase [Methylomirabilota bacterium]